MQTPRSSSRASERSGSSRASERSGSSTASKLRFNDADALYASCSERGGIAVDDWRPAGGLAAFVAASRARAAAAHPSARPSALLTCVVADVVRELRAHLAERGEHILGQCPDAGEGIEVYVGRTSLPRQLSRCFDPHDIGTWSFGTKHSGPASRWKKTYAGDFHGLVVALVVTPAAGAAAEGLAGGDGAPAQGLAAAHRLSLAVEQGLIMALNAREPGSRLRKDPRNQADEGNLAGGEAAHVGAHCVYFAYRLDGVPVPAVPVAAVRAVRADIAAMLLSPVTEGSSERTPPSGAAAAASAPEARPRPAQWSPLPPLGAQLREASPPPQERDEEVQPPVRWGAAAQEADGSALAAADDMLAAAQENEALAEMALGAAREVTLRAEGLVEALRRAQRQAQRVRGAAGPGAAEATTTSAAASAEL